MALNNFVLHVNTALTNVSVQYRNAAFVAGEIFPAIPVTKQSDDFFTYGTDNLRPAITLMAPRTKSNEAIMQRSATPYNASGHALSFPIPDEDRSNDDLLDLDIDATTMLTDKILLDQEINIASQIQAGIPSGNLIDLSANTYENAWDQTTVDPIVAIETQALNVALNTGKKPNLLVLSSPTLAGMRNNPLVKSRITGAPNLDGSAITLQQIANVCNVERCIEAGATLNTSKEGQLDAFNFVWGKGALLCYVPKTPGLRTMSLGYRFMWNYNAIGTGGGAAKPIADLVKGGSGYGVRMWREEGRRTTMIEALMYYSQQIIAPNAGVMWINAVQGW